MAAETGQVWEGGNGWIVVITKADDPTTSSWLVHEIRTIVLPDGAPRNAVPNVIVENVLKGGMTAEGWVRLA